MPQFSDVFNPDIGGFTGATFLPPEKQQAFATLNEFLRDPLQNIASRMGPLLRSLIPSEQAARQGYLDVGRRAGGLRGGAFAQGARQLEGDIFGRRAETATRASLGALAPIMGGYQTALTGIPALERRQEILQNATTGDRGSAGGGAGSDFGGFGYGFNDPRMRGDYNANYGYAGGRAPTGGSNIGYGTGELSGIGDPRNFYDPTSFGGIGGGTAASTNYPWLDFGESPLGGARGDLSDNFDFSGGEGYYSPSIFEPGIYD